MSTQDRLRWDQIYRERQDSPYPPPDPILFEFAPPVTGGEPRRALDLAGGLGQNGLWLAAQGYVVDIMDISRVALLRAQTEINTRKLRSVNLLPVDLDQVELQPNSYDLVCIFRFLKRDLLTQLRATVHPGGRIIYETFNMRYRDLMPDFNPAYLLSLGELSGYFADWKVVYNADTKHISRVVAIKPG